jgi:hypothetical protein
MVAPSFSVDSDRTMKAMLPISPTCTTHRLQGHVRAAEFGAAKAAAAARLPFDVAPR